ncbi:MAG: N-acetylneuraminate synthase family protein [Candidatus Omnitrophica bacterium]|nr:N-acetylneuraminate synthase family protein [Candidatus Omnitrophota bacterium]
MSSVFVIAEAGINHNGSLENCFKLIDAAKQAGCDCIKFQFFKARHMYPRSAGKLDWKDESGAYSYDIYKAVESFELPEAWVRQLIGYCQFKKIEFLASVFDKKGLEYLVEAGMKKIKISSYSITNLPLIEECARFKLPIIMSCGGATLQEVKEAVSVVKQYHHKLALLHCTINYPTRLADCNLGVMKALKSHFTNVKVGYSDHTQEVSRAPVQAVYLGAGIIEKHITLDKEMKGPDHFFALNPYELTCMVQDIRRAEKDMRSGAGKIDTMLYGSEQMIARRHEKYLRDFCFNSLFAKKAIKKGQKIRQEDISILRPGKKARGLDPKYFRLFSEACVTARRDIGQEDAITWDAIVVRRVLFRADAHALIGAGDLMSVMYLASEFKKHNWDTLFMVKDHSPAKQIVKKHKLKNVIWIPADCSKAKEVSFVKEACDKFHVSGLVLELTSRNALKGYEKILGMPFVKKVCIDFDGNILRGFDCVVNWCVDARSQMYARFRDKKTKWLLGFSYAVLPPYLAQGVAFTKKPKRCVRNILITMGGIDTINATATIVRSLATDLQKYNVRIVVGPGYQFLPSLNALKGKLKLKAQVKQNAGTLLNDFRWADFVISAGGLTSCELVAAKIPALLFAVADHQIGRCSYFARKQWACYAGETKKMTDAKIKKNFSTALKQVAVMRSHLSKANFSGGSILIYENISSY